ncbi:hypothetical protein SSP35_01_06080 [Streptomyces sp. NBRC 110611]|nr:hypothetical protein SSP35_01_06080 [Streptomyces sp. NBRC 110611]
MAVRCSQDGGGSGREGWRAKAPEGARSAVCALSGGSSPGEEGAGRGYFFTYSVVGSM